tara:strand:- start:493 stop:759 length:267 start_codon:yes stop_codon:yes gene_type:complete
MKIIKSKCKQEDAEDKTLPTHAYVVGYVDDEFCQDIVVANKQADVFDYYWDLYKEKLQYIKQAAGTVKPNLWQDKNDSTPKPPKKPKK